MSYVEGFLVPVPLEKKAAYVALAEKAAAIFLEYGATEIVECWGDDIRDGKVTDFRMAVKAEPGENVVFSWITYPSKEVRDAAIRKIMSDPRMTMEDMPFSTQRMIFGGFETLLKRVA